MTVLFALAASIIYPVLVKMLLAADDNDDDDDR